MIDWYLSAACKGQNADVWFPDHEDYGPARAVCHACEVRTDCLVYAMQAGMTAGMWGGKTPGERRALRPAYDRHGRRRAPLVERAGGVG